MWQRWVHLAFAVLAGCGAAPVPRESPRELFVDAWRLQQRQELRPFPVDEANESRAYVVVRPFGGAPEAEEKLRMLLGQEPTAEAPRVRPGEGHRAGASEAEHASSPGLLFFPDRVHVRGEAACYLGHAAFPRAGFEPEPGIVHHVRLLVVNRQPRPLDVPLDAVQALSGTPAAALPRLAAANAQGERIERLHVPGHEERLVHLFFADRRVPDRLEVAWELEWPEEGARQRFEASLVRCFVLARSPLAGIERRIAAGEPLPAAPPSGRSWSEPWLAPVPPAPAAGAE